MVNFVQNSFSLNAFFMGQFTLSTDGPELPEKSHLKPYGGIKRYLCGWTWNSFRGDIDILGGLRGAYVLKL